MPRSLHDLERLVSAHRHPRDPGRTQVVKRDVLARRIVLEKVRTLDAGELQVLAQLSRHVLRGRHDEERIVRRHSLTEKRHQGIELLFDRHLARDPGLRGLHASPIVKALDASVHMNDAMIEIDVRTQEPFELAPSHVDVRGHGEDAPPAQRHLGARDERLKLARIKVRLGFLLASVRAVNTVARVVLSHAQISKLGALGVGKRFGHKAPNVRRRFPRNLVRANGAIELLDERLDLVSRDKGNGLTAEIGEHVRPESRAVVHDGRKPARFSRVVPVLDPLVQSPARVDRNAPDLPDALGDVLRHLSSPLFVVLRNVQR